MRYKGKGEFHTTSIRICMFICMHREMVQDMATWEPIFMWIYGGKPLWGSDSFMWCRELLYGFNFRSSFESFMLLNVVYAKFAWIDLDSSPQCTIYIRFVRPAGCASCILDIVQYMWKLSRIKTPFENRENWEPGSFCCFLSLILSLPSSLSPTLPAISLSG